MNRHMIFKIQFDLDCVYVCVLFYQPCTESDEDNAIQLEVKVHQVAESMEKMRRP